MPCRSDYLAASGQELESKRVCKYLVYLYNKVDYVIPEWVTSASEDCYGNVSMLNEATRMLCECCRSFTTEEVEKYIYDAHNDAARQLAGWWEKHQEWDARRVKEENEEKKRSILTKQAMKKLTPEEMDALGL